MIIDDEKKFVFICVAKTASTSMRRRFGYFEDPPPHIYHMFLKDILDKNPHTKDYFKFGFVRNPYDRLYSTYINLKYEGHLWATALKAKRTFEEFVLDFEGSKYSDYIHLQPQINYLINGESIGLDYVGRFENLNDDFRDIEKILGLSHVKLKKERYSRTYPLDPKFYTNSMRGVVCEIYGEDFERFGYEK